MKAAPNTKNVLLDPAEVRAQVARMTASDVFANSPQLSAFLVFIVEAVVRGKGDRLKGYTIGVEVLRRDINFDPQLDPIVRVEATRLRRAIERYYAGPGAHDEIVIDLPRGGYAPRISRRTEHESIEPAADAPEDEIKLAPGNGLPTLRVAPFMVAGTPGSLAIDGDALGGKLCDALALFDMINVVGASPAGGRYDYRLDGTLEYRDLGISLRFRLVDKSDETVIWSRAFERGPGESAAEIERSVILTLASTIAQRFGIIWSHDRARLFAGNGLDPRYRALIEACETVRSFDAETYASARATLERLIVLDPGFAAGFSYLSIIYACDYVHGFGECPDDNAALDRALRTARRGVELKPQSALSYHVLFVVLFFRGETEAACAAAERAIALNPYDVQMLSDYGGRLIFAGHVDAGMDILRSSALFGAILPSWTHFYLFLGHYLRDELAEARFHAGQMTNERHITGQIARALMAHREGNADEARRAIATILALQPQWKNNTRHEIGKLITDKQLADRLSRDLAGAGLRDAED